MGSHAELDDAWCKCYFLPALGQLVQEGGLPPKELEMPGTIQRGTRETASFLPSALSPSRTRGFGSQASPAAGPSARTVLFIPLACRGPEAFKRFGFFVLTPC